MNQVLKRSVYMRGTDKQARFMATLGGMKDHEIDVFMMLHDGKDDQYIMDMLGYSRRSYDLVEESIRSKLLVATMECVNFRMEYGE